MPVVNFDGPTNGFEFTPSYSEDGLTFTSPDHLHFLDDLDGDGRNELMGHDGGSDEIVITKTGGGSFSLISMDVGATYYRTNQPVEWIAYQLVGGVYVETGRMVISATDGHVVFTADFLNIDKVVWNSALNYNGSLVVDNIEYSVSQPAAAQDDAFSTSELNAVSGNLFSDNGSGADSDPDGPALAISAVNGNFANVGTQITLASGALLTVNANGTFSYNPNGAFQYTPTVGSGASNTPSSDSFSYTLAGGNTATVSLTITGVDNNDLVIGTAGIDLLIGGSGADSVYGLDGDDALRGNGGNDSLNGGGGNDFLNGGNGNDIVDGGAGYDRAAYFQSDPALGGITVSLLLQGSAQNVGSQGSDTLINIENVSGTPFADTITGDAGDNWLWGSTSWLTGTEQSATNNDTIDGGGGNDLIEVGFGNHVLSGGGGSDTLLYSENGGAEVGVTISLGLQGGAQTTGAGSWTLNGFENLAGSTGGDQLIGDGNANILAGGDGSDLLLGGGGDDSLYGDGYYGITGSGSGTYFLVADADVANGGVGGNDVLEGGLGNDLINGGIGVDTASYANASGAVTAFLYRFGTGNGEAFGADGDDILVGIENLTGSAFNDQLIGNNLANVISGGDGHDGLRGNGGNDTLYGGNGDDFLNGSAGDDYIDGGDGSDRAAFYEDATSAGVTVDLNLQGVAQDTGQGMDTLVNIENVSGSRYGDHLIGDNNDNWLWGSASTLIDGTIVTTNNDTLSGGGGNDLLTVGIGNHVVDGGSGNDTFRFNENGAPESGITLSLLLQGSAQASGNGEWTLTGIENLSGGTAGDNLTGDGNANVLAGDAGNDTLTGGAGNDVLYGDGQISWDGHGTGGSGPITTVSDVGVSFGAIDGNDTLEGGLGDDLINGGGGVDTASYANAAGGVTAFLYNAGNGNGEASGADGNDTLVGIENITGSAYRDFLTGNALDNVLTGGDGLDDIRGRDGNDTLLAGNGNDYLIGGLGDDIIDGGAGFDRASFYFDATSGVTVDLNFQGVAQNTGQGMDILVGIENVSGSIYADTLTGDAGDNWLWGSAATLGDGSVSAANNDTLDGGGGNDLLTVGIGDHTLIGGSGTDTVSFTENGQGPETGATVSLGLQGSAQATGNGSWTLTGIENLSGGIANDTLTGDGNVNVLAGNAGNDTLIGGAGDDTLYGDGLFNFDGQGTGGSGPITLFPDVGTIGGVSGNDLLEGGLGDDTINGGGGIDTASYANASGGVNVNLGTGFASGADGNDTLVNIENVTGSAFNDNITGSGGGNVLDGLGGNDTLSGGAGDDTLYGGDGDDFLQGDFNENNISITGNDILYGGNGNDLLRGGLGDDQFYGGANNDQFRGNGGIDYFDGGADDGQGVNGIGDRVSFFEQRATQGVVADLRTGIISNDGFGNVETMVGIESLGGDTAFIDTFYGNDERNYLAGGRGDFVYGFGGDDLFQMISATAVLDGGSGIDRISLFITASGQLLPDSNGDGLAEFAAAATAGFTVNLAAGTILDGYGFSGTVTGIENVDGTILADTLIGDGNANVFNSFDGNDLLEGRGGNDTLDGGNGIDTASYANASGGVTVTLTASGGSSSGADGNDTLLNIENITGSAFDDALTGNALDNVIAGGDGHDFLRGYAGNDALYGEGGDDYLSGGIGDDLLDGGAGWDRVSFFQGASGGVTVDLRIIGAQNTGLGVDTLVGIEQLSGTVFSDTLIGDGGDNWLWGTSDGDGGNDTLDGQGGNDLLENGAGDHTIAGGAGIDTFLFSTLNTVTGINVSLALQGAAQGTGVGMMTLTGIENLSGSVYADTLTGDGGDNVLAGAGGDDTLIGGAGNDVLYGDGSIGLDTHGIGGSGPITTTADNGAAGNDTLQGGLGDDTINGGGGIDTASYANAAGSVTVTLTASGGSSSGTDGSDTLLNIESILGGAFNDVLTGNGAANLIDGGGGHDKLFGGAGDDTLLGGNGDDTLTGGAGDDVYNGGAGFDRASFFGATAGVTVDLTLAGAQNSGQGMDTLTGIENLTGTQYADTLIGDAGDNWLWGFATSTVPGTTGNNDTLNGGGGNDLLWAGNGNQTLIGGTGNDTVMYNENFSSDVSVTISLLNPGVAQNTGQGMWTLTGIENLVGGTANDVLTGDGANNILCGGAGTDTLNGGIGNDTLYGDGAITFDDRGTGGSGPIIIVGDAVAVYGGVAGNDKLNGGDGDDFLYGGGGNDALKGDKGNDTLYGGTGNDSLVGGQGNDRYVIEANSGADTISGFTHVDRIVFDTSSGITSFAQLTLTATGGTNTLVTWGNGNSILIEGLRPRDMTAADFQFTTAAGFEHVSHDFTSSYAVPHDIFI